MEKWPLHEKREKEKHPAEKLRALISDISHEINESAEGEYGIRNLVDMRGAICMDNFLGSEGYSDDKIYKDKESIHAREIEWSGAGNSRVKEFYKERYGAETEEDIVNVYLKNKEREKNGQMEMFTSVLFHKILKNEFVVMRASAYDDYVNGIDTVMVNKKTGDIVCAFDEVHNHKNSARAEEKSKKTIKKAREGGATLSYGIEIENGKMKRKEIKNLPVFFIGLETEELEDVLANMDYGKEISPKEKKVFAQFVSSLEMQKQILLSERLPESVRANLTRFSCSLETMKSVISTHTL